jgi:hypothetical protein
MKVFRFSKLPKGFASWHEYLNSTYSTHNLCENKKNEFNKLYQEKMQQFCAPLTPLSANCIVITYPLSNQVFAINPMYGNYSFRFLNTDTGTRRQVPFQDHRQHGLNNKNGTCLLKAAWPFYSRQAEIDQIAKSAYDKWTDDLLSLSDRFKEFITPVKLPSTRERYALYLQSKQWHEKSLVVKQRDRFRCVACYSKSALQVHHNTYERWGNEAFDDLVTVCRECHARIHGLFPV